MSVWRCAEGGALRVVGFLVHKHVRVRHPEKCRGCGKCAAVFPSGAIVLCERSHEVGRLATLVDTANVWVAREKISGFESSAQRAHREPVRPLRTITSRQRCFVSLSTQRSLA